MLGPNERTAFNALLAALADAFALEGRAGGDLAAAALRAAMTRPYRRARATSAPGLLLDAACALPEARPIAALVLACRPAIDWTHWEGEGLAGEVSSRLHTAELVGPDGHIAADGVRVGLLISDAGTDYPVSSHSGEETYYVIAGVAEWTVADTPYAQQPPGALIHHPAWAAHGRRTRSEPFLGAWRWSGDLDLSSFTILD